MSAAPTTDPTRGPPNTKPRPLFDIQPFFIETRSSGARDPRPLQSMQRGSRGGAPRCGRVVDGAEERQASFGEDGRRAPLPRLEWSARKLQRRVVRGVLERAQQREVVPNRRVLDDAPVHDPVGGGPVVRKANAGGRECAASYLHFAAVCPRPREPRRCGCARRCGSTCLTDATSCRRSAAIGRAGARPTRWSASASKPDVRPRARPRSSCTRRARRATCPLFAAQHRSTLIEAIVDGDRGWRSVDGLIVWSPPSQASHQPLPLWTKGSMAGKCCSRTSGCPSARADQLAKGRLPSWRAINERAIAFRTRALIPPTRSGARRRAVRRTG